MSNLGRKFPNRKKPVPFSAEHRANISKAGKGRPHTEETKQKISEARKGMQFSDEHRLNISKSLIGTQRAKGSIRTPEQRRKISEFNKGKYTGEENNKWKGDKVGYHALHNWVARQLGKPSKCEHCSDTTAKRYEWANISREYKRDISDWVRLCSSCHHTFDDMGKKAWITRRLRMAA